ncbi:hypothetical protein GCM10027285_06180 [Oleiagrimonas citrea]
MGRPKVLLVTRNLPPLVGGMERLNWNMARQLARVADVLIVGPRGSAALAPEGVRVHEVALMPLARFLWSATWVVWREARRWRPDWVLAGSGLTAPLAWLAARTCGARAAVYVHGLDLALRHRLYRLLWFPAIRRMDRVIANSRATRLLAEERGVPSEHIGLLHPGVEMPDSTPFESDVPVFRMTHGLAKRPVLLSVGRLTERKGLREFVRDVLPVIVAQRPSVVLIVIGDTAAQALHAKSQSVESIRELAARLGLESNLRFLGVITDRQELSAAYRAADVHVFPVREIPGDPEGFGMVAVEAAAHGLATVAYATGGVLDAVREGDSGRLVPPGDASSFASAVLALLDSPLPREALRCHAESFTWECFGEGLRDLLALPGMAGGAKGAGSSVQQSECDDA